MALLRCRPQMRRWIRLRWLVQIHEPGWRNWQTQRTQNPPGFGPWGFDPPSRHHLKYQYHLWNQRFATLVRLCVFDVFRSILRSGTSSGTVRTRPISNNLNRLAADFITASFRYLRQITGCAADLVSKHEFPAPSSRSQVHIARLARAGAACGRAWMR